MIACVFCKRDVPSLPMYAPSLRLCVAHVSADGEPCHEGTTPEQHGASLAEYPHDELMDDDELWDLDDLHVGKSSAAVVPLADLATPAPLVVLEASDPEAVAAVEAIPQEIRKKQRGKAKRKTED